MERFRLSGKRYSGHCSSFVVGPGGSYRGGVFYFAPETVTRPAGEVKSLLLHHSSFSTITTLETTEGWYQLEGAVSGARGDIVSIQTTAGYQKACLKSKDSKACYDFR